MISVKPHILTLLGGVLLGSLSLSAVAQAPSELYRNTQTATHGTARAQGMGGAVGAVGADPSAILVNPAGLAMYSTNILSLTLDPGWGNATVDWRGHLIANNTLERNSVSYRMGNLANAAVVTPLLQNYSGGSLVNINLSFVYDRAYNYSRKYDMITGPLTQHSFADYLAARAIASGFSPKELMATKDYDPLTLPGVDPLAVMGLNSYLIEGKEDDTFMDALGRKHYRYSNGIGLTFIPNSGDKNELRLIHPIGSNLKVQENGARHDMDFAMGMTIGDYVQLGASLRIGTVSNSKNALYREDYYDESRDYNNEKFINDSHFVYNYGIHSYGSSFGINIGAMFMLGEWGRLGISYLTPQYLHMREVFSAQVDSYNATYRGDEKTSYVTQEMESAYSMIIPGRLTVSAAGLLGRYGMVSYDMEWTPLSTMRMLQNNQEITSVTDIVRQDYGHQLTHRVGIEVLPYQGVSVRAGFSYTGNPMRNPELRQQPAEGLSIDPGVSGVDHSFTLPRTYTSYSGGIGYRINSYFGVDIAYVRQVQKQKVYAFGGYEFDAGNTTSNGAPIIEHINAFGGTLKQVSNNIVATATLYF